MDIFTKAFWLATLERAIRTFAQTAAALIGTPWILEAATEVQIDIDPLGILAASAVAALVSVLTSVGTHKATKTGPSFVTAETLSPPAPAIPVE